MRAIVITEPGGPEVLQIRELPEPVPAEGEVLIRVRAFGVNHAETHMRKGEWPEATPVSGIEAVGTVARDPAGAFGEGTTVATIMGGLGRTRNGSYAEYVAAPSTNVAAIDTSLSWTDLAAIPESYATAWSVLHGNLQLHPGHHLLVRGATSALGQAAINIANDLGATVIATTRREDRADLLRSLGADEVVIDGGQIAEAVRGLVPGGVDRVLDLVGNSVLRDSLKAVRVNGRVCQAGFLGGLGPVDQFLPIVDMPSGVQFSFFGSFELGTDAFPLSAIPVQSIVDKVEAGDYIAHPARVFAFDEIAEAHQIMDSGQAGGKLVVEGA
ncbi:MAG TPA: zinc-binding dehydrogenase [Streptosporangiaceae bacterium]|nr:zinc-binding dehydrogenase [Streptosporangiaceae bacterium]